MTRIALDIDPRTLTRLRALANRRGVTVDVVAGELLAAGVRSPLSQPARAVTRDPGAVRFGLIEVEYPDEPEIV